MLFDERTNDEREIARLQQQIEALRQQEQLQLADIASLMQERKELRNALEVFAEEPNERMDSYHCHIGITTKEKCSRCKKAITAYHALNKKGENNDHKPAIRRAFGQCY